MVTAHTDVPPGNSPQDAVAAVLEQIAPLGSGPPVDLIVATGNLAGHALPAEYDTAWRILTTLGDQLAVGRDRVVVVPGDHDVNRGKCEAHFLRRQASDEKPTPPYWEKWQPFASIVRRLHDAELPKDQPWTLHAYPDLRVVVAGLNSTMAHCHLVPDPHGRLGPEQVRWFAETLASPDYAGWLRLGVVHHWPGRHGIDRIHDTEDLTGLIGPHLDVILSGRTGERTAGTIDNVVSALEPYGIPRLAHAHDGGWQLVDIHADHVQFVSGTHNLAPVPLPHARPSSGPPGSGGATAAREGATVPGSAGWRRRPRSTTPGRAGSELVNSVAEACRLRYPAADVTAVAWHGEGCTAYVRVSPRGRGGAGGYRGPAEQCPVGVCATTPTWDGVRHFVDEVLARFRTSDVRLDAVLVHEGPPAEPALREWASGRGVEIVSLAAFQLGDDLDPFLTAQADRLRVDRVYPADLYVPQRYTEIRHAGTTTVEDPPQRDLLASLRSWIDRPDGRLVLVLGTFGHGKTFLLRELARRMHSDGCATVPLLVDVRGLSWVRDLDELLSAYLTSSGVRQLDLNLVRYLVRAGRVALLLDGFDELSERVSYERAANRLRTIVQAATDHTKVIITCRDQHFLTDAAALAGLGGPPDGQRRIVKLAGFDREQIQTFLVNRLGDGRSAADRLERLRALPELSGLASNPRMLAFLTDLDPTRLPTAAAGTGEVSSADVYREILDRWLDREAARLDPFDPLAPTGTELLATMTQLAVRSWNTPGGTLDLDDLGDAARNLVAPEPGPDLILEAAETAHLLGSRALLVRDPGGRFTFLHESVREWLIARHLASHFTAKPPATVIPAADLRLLGRLMSPLVIDFLCAIAGNEAMSRWVEEVLGSGNYPEGVRQNAVNIQRRLRGPAGAPRQLAGLDLRGRDLSGSHWLRGADLSGANLADCTLRDADLTGADLTGANLTGATLVHANLTRTTLVRACLVGARLDRACLVAADLTGADLTLAGLAGADFSDAVLAPASLRRAALVGATGIPRGALRSVDTYGAALPEDQRPVIQFDATAPVRAVALHPASRLIAGAGGGAVRLWSDTPAGLLVRTLHGHSGDVHTVACSPDGTRIASAGRDGTVRIWDPATGATITVLAGHGAWIRALSYSPDGSRLASAGHDNAVRLWDTASGAAVRVLTGHTAWVRCLSHAPDGRYLASASDDETVRIWDTRTGDTLRVLAAHEGGVHAVAYAPAGDRLASAGDDRCIHIWDLVTGRVIRTIRDDTGGWIRALAYHPDGQWLACAGDDGIITLRDAGTGEAVRTLRGHTGAVLSLVFPPDGLRLISAGDDGKVRTWDLPGGSPVRVLQHGRLDTVVVRFSPDGQRLASGDTGGTVRLWTARPTTPATALLGHAGRVNALAFSPDSQRLASGGDDGTVHVWDTRGTERVRMFSGHEGPVRGVAFTTDGRRVVSAGTDATVRIWSIADSTPCVLRGHTGAVLAVATSRDGGYLASAGRDGGIRIWSPDGRALATLTGHDSDVHALAFSPDGRGLAGGDAGGTVRLWSTATGRTAWVARLHGEVRTLDFSTDGGDLASAGDDGMITISDPATGRTRRTVATGAGWLRSIAYAPRSGCLAAAGADRAIRLWDTTGWLPRAHLVPLAGESSAVLLADLRYAIHGDASGEFWYVIGTCRFESGQLDRYVAALAPVPPDVRLW